MNMYMSRFFIVKRLMSVLLCCLSLCRPPPAIPTFLTKNPPSPRTATDTRLSLRLSSTATDHLLTSIHPHPKTSSVTATKRPLQPPILVHSLLPRISLHPRMTFYTRLPLRTVPHASFYMYTSMPRDVSAPVMPTAQSCRRRESDSLPLS